MKALIALSLLALTVFSQTSSQSDRSDRSSGLQLTDLSFTKKFIKLRGFSGSMVSHDPPILDNSTIMIPGPASKNPVIRNKTETATNAASARRVGGQPQTSVVWDWKGWVYNFEATVKNSTTKPVRRFVWAYTVPTDSATQK